MAISARALLRSPYRWVGLLGLLGLGLSGTLYLTTHGHGTAEGEALTLLGAGLGTTFLICLLLAILVHQNLSRAALLKRCRAAEDSLRQTFETNSAIKLIIDPADGRIVDANSAAVSFYGYPRQTLLGMRIDDINTLPEAEVKAEMAPARETQRLHFSFRHRLAGGEMRDVEVYSGPIDTARGRLLYSIIHDVTEHKQVEQALRESESRFRQLAENIDSAFWMISPDWRRVQYVSPAYERIWGRSAQRLYADGMDWFDAVLEEDRPAIMARIPAAGSQAWQSIEFAPYRIRHPDTGIRWIAARAFAIHDARGEVIGVAGIAEDITERHEHQRHLEDLAHYDALTRLPNRLLLADRMRQALARSRRSGQLLATCLLDLDGFKPVNDQYGHEAGDKLLVQLAQRLQEGVRGDDTVARLGGDEFVLLLGGLASIKEAEEALDRMLALISLPYQIHDQQVTISASIGVTVFPNDRGDADTLLRHADHAMYLAKQAGKNRYHLFNPVLEHRERENRKAMQLIARAVERNELCLYYQPIVDSRQGRVIAMEALLRWQHPVLGLLGPPEFLPLVENDQTLVVRIGSWVLRQALEQLHTWQREGLAVSVSVNMFAQHLRDPGFPSMLEKLLKEFPDVPAKHLTLEILETTALEDMGGVIQLIRAGERLGMHYALDDFGTGYSSLTYLRRLPVHTLKIDQSFVRDMLQDPEDMTIVEGIIGLANAFRHGVVAEGVETTDHALMLMEMGCHLVQGHGIASPMPAEETTDWLRAFQPDPRWLVNASKRLAHDDHQLVLAEVHHRQWLAHLLSWGRADLDDRGTPPPEDPHACNFGQWFHGEGTRRYGHLAPFRATGPIHERVHALAHEYILSVQDGDRQRTQYLEAELHSQRSELLDALSRLRAAVMYIDAGQ
ncbi:MAG TPA: EAL domain-containing protein [Thiobacillaceae bacterium]|nr:EAL domain-containing protein [Thiobacillaceae bacterium]